MTDEKQEDGRQLLVYFRQPLFHNVPRSTSRKGVFAGIHMGVDEATGFHVVCIEHANVQELVLVPEGNIQVCRIRVRKNDAKEESNEGHGPGGTSSVEAADRSEGSQAPGADTAGNPGADVGPVPGPKEVRKRPSKNRSGSSRKKSR